MRAKAGGVELDYQIEGQGPWLILSHALTTNHSMWDLQMPQLIRKFRVLRYDMRGHGHSAAPEGPYSFDELAGDVLGLMDALGILRASYIGLSIGGMIGQHLALRAPERFERMVLANTTSRISPEGVALWDERIRLVETQGLETIVQGTLERWFTAPYRQTY
ncbi:MAG: alpha/beta fold hydrolase, partial [Betaproteobacteria bacterium]|nr:alpha/beta fold hydrolase [Betaproteobacteria bacterium]